MSPQKSLTTHLPTLTPHSLLRATTHPFLQRAGQGTLPKPVLEQWLSQDRLYAQSYIRFIGLLLSKIRFPAKPHSQSPTETQLQSASLESRLSSTLIDALVNIRREIEFFEATASNYAFNLNAQTPTPAGEEEEGSGKEFGPNAITHAYIDLFMAAGSPGASLLEGMVVLWATETCYLRAWRFAAGFLDQRQGQGAERDTDGGALRKEFIPNWSSREFEGFVDGIGELVDEMAGGVVADGEVMRRCERWWRQVVWLEERFWPDVSL